MKKGTVIGIVLAVCSLLALGALALYLALMNFDTFILTDQNSLETKADAAIQALYETETQPSTELPLEESSAASFIWAGDSRTLGMQDAMNNDDIYIGASGEGYYWLFETGLPLIKEAITANPGLPVIFNFGVNDYDNLENYLSLYEEILAEYPDTHFYFLAVNPIEPTLCSNITNEEITDFNSHLKESFGDAYLDSFTYLMINEVVPFDGVHYSEEGYQLIYEYAAQQISKKEQS